MLLLVTVTEGWRSGAGSKTNQELKVTDGRSANEGFDQVKKCAL